MNLSIVILSRDAANLVPCVNSITRNDFDVPIIVVDDGAQANVTHELPVRWVTGKKPFVFARNANMGIEAAGRDDVLLLNDDTLLETPRGFSRLAERSTTIPTDIVGEWLTTSPLGIIAASTNSAGNHRQMRKRGTWNQERPTPNGAEPAVDIELRMVCFIAVLIRRALIDQIGGLDEDLIGYGFDDDAYCFRARQAGWQIGIWDGCFVDHTSLKSTYRREDEETHWRKLAINLQIYERKYGPHPTVPPEWRERIARMKVVA